MVQEACTYVDEITDSEQKLKLIDTLRQVTAGKIYVEIERARLTRKLAFIKESSGDVSEAANILNELQVETYGSMEKREKIEFLLEQMRLCLIKRDFIRTQIISRKISTRAFEDETFHVRRERERRMIPTCCPQFDSQAILCYFYVCSGSQSQVL